MPGEEVLTIPAWWEENKQSATRQTYLHSRNNQINIVVQSRKWTLCAEITQCFFLFEKLGYPPTYREKGKKNSFGQLKEKERRRKWINYLEKKNIFGLLGWKRTEKVENIKSRKISGQWKRRKRRKISKVGKYLVSGREGKGGKYSEKKKRRRQWWWTNGQTNRISFCILNPFCGRGRGKIAELWCILIFTYSYIGLHTMPHLKAGCASWLDTWICPCCVNIAQIWIQFYEETYIFSRTWKTMTYFMSLDSWLEV